MEMIKRILNKITKKGCINYRNTEAHRIINETSEHILYQLRGHDLKLRKHPSSDYNVFTQVFIDKEYEPPISYFLKNNIELKTVIDAGANIGLTSAYIKNEFPNAKIVCIEPDNDNFELLSYNLKTFIKD